MSHSQLHQLPYSSLPNTRPRVSSPLVSELTFNPDLIQLINNPESPNTILSTNTFLLVFFLIDSLAFVQLARCALPYLHLHLHSLLPFSPTPAQELAETLTNIPSNLVIPTIAMVKSISGICLLNTGTTWTSYLIRNALFYTILAALLSFPNPTPIISVSILCVFLLAGSIVICLPLLRLIQILLDLEDQQTIRNRHRKTIHPHQLRRSSNHNRNSNLLQARYQHLMNPF